MKYIHVPADEKSSIAWVTTLKSGENSRLPSMGSPIKGPGQPSTPAKHNSLIKRSRGSSNVVTSPLTTIGDVGICQNVNSDVDSV